MRVGPNDPDVFRLAQAVKQSNADVRMLGYEPRQLQLKWRTDPPPIPVDGPGLSIWCRECAAAIIDALVHEGVVAWDGDAVACVAQIVAAAARSTPV